MTLEYSIATRETLLQRLKGIDDHASWQDFFDTYWRLIYGVAMKAGLNEDEAHDVVQDTVVTVARNMPEFQYDPEKCTFKTWLLNLTRWRIVDQLRKRKSAVARGEAGPNNEVFGVALEEIADPAGCNLEKIWNEEWEANLFETASQRVKRQVKPKQYQMFYLHVLKELPVKEVAARVGASVAAVYLAKHRVGRIFKRETRLLQGHGFRFHARKLRCLSQPRPKARLSETSSKAAGRLFCPTQRTKLCRLVRINARAQAALALRSRQRSSPQQASRCQCRLSLVQCERMI